MLTLGDRFSNCGDSVLANSILTSPTVCLGLCLWIEHPRFVFSFVETEVTATCARQWLYFSQYIGLVTLEIVCWKYTWKQFTGSKCPRNVSFKWRKQKNKWCRCHMRMGPNNWCDISAQSYGFAHSEAHTTLGPDCGDQLFDPGHFLQDAGSRDGLQRG